MAFIKTSESDDKYINIITSVAGAAAASVDGVASVSNLPGTLFTNAKTMDKTIQVFLLDDFVTIELSLNCYEGYRVPDLVCEVQQTVKSEVEKATRFRVKAVNVNIVGVVFQA